MSLNRAMVHAYISRREWLEDEHISLPNTSIRTHVPWDYMPIILSYLKYSPYDPATKHWKNFDMQYDFTSSSLEEFHIFLQGNSDVLDPIKKHVLRGLENYFSDEDEQSGLLGCVDAIFYGNIASAGRKALEEQEKLYSK